jgi:hypothetical protein
MDNRTPTARDAAAARTLLQALTPRERPRKLSLTVEQREAPILDSMVPALVEAAKPISEGHAIEVMPADDEVSAQEAADLLKGGASLSLGLGQEGDSTLPHGRRSPSDSDGRVDHLQT